MFTFQVNLPFSSKRVFCSSRHLRIFSGSSFTMGLVGGGLGVAAENYYTLFFVYTIT